MVQKKRRRIKSRTHQNLLVLIVVLTAVLIGAVTVALAIDRNQQMLSGSESTETAGQTLQSTGDTQQDPSTEQTAPSQTTTAPETTTSETSVSETTVPETTVPETTVPETTAPSVTPDYGEYIDVGSGYIAEIITYSAETFNGKTSDDYSAPIRNFLPEGTVDYASTRIISNSTMDYVLLRCGRRVYLEKNNNPSTVKLPVVECYEGTLPDHNEVGFVSMEQQGHFTVLTMDVLWKAPFYFDILPQNYMDPGSRDYRVTAFTAQYVDITFCYATVFEGTVSIGSDHPLFSSAEVIQNESDCILRLYLKKTGGFYGYDSYYNENDQLCFKFLNPVRAAATSDNSYGADLSGIRILIDVGHGGVDGGSTVTDSTGTKVEEADLNLKMAKALQQELESMGATVILNRTDDTKLNVDDRVKNLKEAAPDLCICIHHNSDGGVGDATGLQVCYSTPMSHDLATLIYNKTVNAGIYKEAYMSWHYYFVAKQTNCPIVLMECGYMSNASDLADMLSSTVTQQKAQAMAKAVAEYFLNIG